MQTTRWNPDQPGDRRANHQSFRRQRGGPQARGRRGGPHRGRGGPFGAGGAFFGPAWAPVFGPGGPGGRRGPGGRGPRVRRGDVRYAILDVLNRAEGGLNGYQVSQQIAERTDDAWRPSPGSVYPTIAQLEDEGLVTAVTEGTRKSLELTPEGRQYAADHAAELAAVWAPFEPGGDGAGTGSVDALKPVIAQTMTAMWQIAATGSTDQHERAVEVLAETRRQLFGILADGPMPDDRPHGEATADA